MKKTFKSILVNTPLEIHARAFTDSGNYEKINANSVVKIREKKKIEYLFTNKKGDIHQYKNLKLLSEQSYKLDDSETKNWLRSHGGNNNLKYSDYSEINEKNVNKVDIKWVYKDKGSKFSNIQLNPVYVDDHLYFTSGNGKIISINAVTGIKKWSLQSVKNIKTRGITLDKNKNGSYFLYVPIDKKVFKIKAENGSIDYSFGNNGSINVFTLSAPIISKNKMCIAQMVPAKIKCFNKLNGEFIFEINVHPKNKDFKFGGTIWGGIAFDKKNEIIYAVTGNPRPALVGISRAGNNENSNSIVALDLKSQKVLWSHQDVIHDLWDYDISSPPVIIDLPFENSIYPAIIVISKIGNIYVFNRITGKTYFDINYKKAKKSKIIDEQNSLFQTKINNPKPLQDLKIKLNDFKSNTLNSNKTKFDIKHFVFGEFEPPKLGGEVIIKGLHGGVTWPGISVNPRNKVMFVPVNNLPYKLKLEMKTYSRIIKKNNMYKFYKNNCSSCHGKYRNGDFEFSKNYIPSLVGHSLFNKEFEKIFSSNYLNKIHNKRIINGESSKNLKKLFKQWDQNILKESEFFYKYNWSEFLDSKNLPATKPPWGEVAAIDIVSGKELWKSKVGTLNGSMIGTSIYGGLASNGGNILVVTGTNDNYVYFINQKNGKILKTFEMETAGSSPPIIYRTSQGQQISIIAGSMNYNGYNKNYPTSIYTFKLND
tara:strand:- start:1089 stop:3209 length:2121 start_codon:yes stop_codon:yes gene_type:complete